MPLQGAPFMCMREKILNIPASKVANVHRSVLKECTMRDKGPKTEDPINAGENKNAGEGNKINKTGENEIKRRQGKQE